MATFGPRVVVYLLADKSKYKSNEIDVLKKSYSLLVIIVYIY